MTRRTAHDHCQNSASSLCSCLFALTITYKRALDARHKQVRDIIAPARALAGEHKAKELPTPDVRLEYRRGFPSPRGVTHLPPRGL